jgi:hypothetical protein
MPCPDDRLVIVMTINVPDRASSLSDHKNSIHTVCQWQRLKHGQKPLRFTVCKHRELVETYQMFERKTLKWLSGY